MPKTKFTSADILSALTLEARRLNISYAELLEQLKNRPCMEQEIVKAYIKQKKEKEKRKAENCKGCAYNVLNRDKSGMICSFNQTGRVRRRDKDGNCLEYAEEKEKMQNRRRIRDTPTKFQRLLSGDWSNKTVFQIAQELETREDYVRQMMYDAQKLKGVNISYKKIYSGRKTPEIFVPEDAALTPRQREYLDLYTAGKSYTEIAEEKGVALCTVAKALNKFKAKKD